MGNPRLYLTLCILSLGVVFYNGCSNPDPITAKASAEPTYCGSTIAQSGTTVTVSGSAGYYYRTPSSTGLSAVSGTTNPIRYAEYHVVDASGNILQCGETDGTGNFSFTITSGSTSLTLQVISRGYNANHKTSVLNTPTGNQYYKITTSFTPSSNVSGLTLTAPATGTLEGGAFNILDKILDADNFLKSATASCGTLSGTYRGQAFSCTPFAVNYKIHVYWKPGFNPNTYLGAAPNDTLSFYDPTQDNLYICGGVSGDVDSSDTDHFDYSIIVHEYGHFIENHYSISDSPGGSHSGTRALDPRLILSEGMQNFFQAAVTGSQYYIDTVGTPSGNTYSQFYIDLENRSSASNLPGPACFDCATNSGEGNFREFAETRALYDLQDTHVDGVWDTVANDYQEIWAAFTALKSLPVHFRDLGLLYEVHNSITGKTSWSSVIGNELQAENRSGYATRIQNGPCTTTLNSSAQISGMNTSAWPAGSGLFNAFNFFDYNVVSGGITNFALTYPSGTNFHFYVYNELYTLYDTTTMIASYETASACGSTTCTANVSASFTPGHYLVVVQYYSGSGAATYTLTGNGVQICPAP